MKTLHPIPSLLLSLGLATAFLQADNEFLGTDAGIGLGTGDWNVLLGDFAGNNVSTSSENTIVGAYAGNRINDGSSGAADGNVLIGFRAGGGYTQLEVDNFALDPVSFPLPDIGLTGSGFDGNVFIGRYAGLRSRWGGDNVFIGDEAGMQNTGTDNTFIGSEAGENNTSGLDNTFVGEEAGFRNTTGDDNTFIGEDAGAIISTGRGNTAVGSGALSMGGALGSGDSLPGASYSNVAVGHDAGYDVGSQATTWNNTFVGAHAGGDNGSGHVNTFVGAGVGANSEHADYCTFVGGGAGRDNNRTNNRDDANRNTYLGAAAGFANREGSDNVALGSFADFGTWEGATLAEIDDALAGGSWGGFGDLPDRGMYGLGILGTGSTEGVNPGIVDISRTIMLGSYATARRDDAISLGFSADAIEERSIAIGSGAQTTHDDSIAIGYQAASHGADIAVIGNATTASIDPGVDGVTALGSGNFRYSEANAKSYNALADAATAATMAFVADTGAQNDDRWRLQAADSDAFTIASFATGAYVDVISAANNGDVTVAGDVNVNSDGRLKEKVNTIGDALKILEDVKGRTYKWKAETGRGEGMHYGLIAQEVEAVIPELVSTRESDGIKSVNYQGFVPILINAVDELKEQNRQQQKASLRQEEEIKLLREHIALQQQLLEKLSATDDAQ